jgi:hypothetical protein
LISAQFLIRLSPKLQDLVRSPQSLQCRWYTQWNVSTRTDIISVSLSANGVTIHQSLVALTGWSVFTRWFKYDRDWLCVNKSQFVPVIFKPPCTWLSSRRVHHKCIAICRPHF